MLPIGGLYLLGLGVAKVLRDRKAKAQAKALDERLKASLAPHPALYEAIYGKK